VEDWWKFKVAKMRKEEGHPVLKNDIFVTRLVLRSAEIQPLIPRFLRFSLFDLNRLEFNSNVWETKFPQDAVQVPRRQDYTPQWADRSLLPEIQLRAF
jgi:hypothetical protein